MQILKLTDTQLDECQIKARDRAINRLGSRPDQDNFTRRWHVARYPGWLMFVAVVLIIVVLVFAGYTSLKHVTNASFDTHEEKGAEFGGVGFSTFIMAEVAVIIIVLTLSIFDYGRLRWLMYLGVVVAIAVAFAGNWIAISPHTYWEWLLVVTPPFLTLVILASLERVLLSTLKDRYEWRAELTETQQDWDIAAGNIEMTPAYRTALANLVWDKLVSKNGRKAARKQWFLDLSDGQRVTMVHQQLQRLDWYGNSAAEAVPEIATDTPEVKNIPEYDGHIPVIKDSGRLNGLGHNPDALARAEAFKAAAKSEGFFDGVKQLELAERWGVSQSLVSKVKNGKR